MVVTGTKCITHFHNKVTELVNATFLQFKNNVKKTRNLLFYLGIKWHPVGNGAAKGYFIGVFEFVTNGNSAGNGRYFYICRR